MEYIYLIIALVPLLISIPVIIALIHAIKELREEKKHYQQLTKDLLEDKQEKD